MNQLINVKVGTFWSKRKVRINRNVKKLKPSYPEKWVTHYNLNLMETEDCFAATCMIDNQNHKKDLGQEGRLNLKVETTKTQHIYQTTQP